MKDVITDPAPNPAPTMGGESPRPSLSDNHVFHPSSFILHLSSFIFHPSTFIPSSHIQLPSDPVLSVFHLKAGGSEGIADLVAGSPVFGSFGLGT